MPEEQKEYDTPSGKHPGGRPLLFETKEDLEAAIEGYFKETGLQTVGDNLVYVPATITSLAVHLNVDRQTIYNYEKKDKYFDAIKKARTKCEADIERGAMMNKLNPTMCIFSLKNNHDWKDKKETDSTLRHKFDDMSNHELATRIKHLQNDA